MTNFLVLYNPYYQNDVIVSHLNVLLSSPDQSNAKVAFGKIRSKLRNGGEPSMTSIPTDYGNENYIQLFLTDYADMYVAKVVEITTEDRFDIAPNYYKEKNLDVEMWFVLTDIRQIIQNDFQYVRDHVLANMTTPSFANHHYAVYGNSYTYPLEICMDEPVDYFEDKEVVYYTDIFKSAKYLETKAQLIHYRFGNDIFYALHPNSQESIIAAEIEYAQNHHDPLYDYSAVVIKYAKAVELELYLFIRTTTLFLTESNPAIGTIPYQVQGSEYQVNDLRHTKPNIGTYKFLLGHPDIRTAIQNTVENNQLRNFLQHGLRFAIHTIQEIRNESAHGSATHLGECDTMRSSVIGIGVSGILSDLIINKKRIPKV